MLGTPDYIAPEQIRDAQSADIRADIYSLGCTLYYMLKGGPPFAGDNLWDVYQAHFSMAATPLNLARPEVPAELAALVAKMMAKEPGRRFQEPKEVAQALVPFFKPAAPQPSRSSAAIPRIESQVAPVQPSSVRPAPSQPATPPPIPAPTAPKPLKTGADGVAWESLIEIKEDEPLIEVAKPIPAQTKPAPVQGPVRRPPWVWMALLAASAFAALALGVIIYVATDHGRIKIIVDDPKAIVQIDGKTVRIEGLDEPITLRAGEHVLTVERGDTKVEDRKFVVRRGDGNESLRVEYEQGPRESKPPMPTADKLSAWPDATPFRGNRYRLFHEQLTWHEARDRCVKMGGRLAIVRGEEEMRFLTSLVSSTKLDSAWLGASDEQEEGRWVWGDGTEMRYENWAAGQPNNDGGGLPEHYLLMVAPTQGVWWDLPDTAQPFFHPGFICQWKDASARPTEKRPVVRTIPEDAKTFEGKRYKVFAEELTWHGARLKCEEMGGRLAVVRGEGENRFVTSLLAAQGLGTAWLGATDEKAEGRWVWLDGTELQYQNWVPANRRTGAVGAAPNTIYCWRARPGHGTTCQTPGRENHIPGSFANGRSGMNARNQKSFWEPSIQRAQSIF